MLSKSDFLQYLENPLHFWAQKQGLARWSPDVSERFLIQQGYEFELLVTNHLQQKLTTAETSIVPQKTIYSGELKARVDLWVENMLSKHISIYEIKGSTGIKDKHLWDVAFQYYLASKEHQVDSIYLLHINKHYRLLNQLNLDQFIQTYEVLGQIQEKLGKIENLIQQAITLANQTEKPRLPGCNKVRDCHCPEICFGTKPSITSFYYLHGHKPEHLPLTTDMKDLDNFDNLSSIQQKQIRSAQTNKPIIDQIGLRTFLERLKFPLWFLDYESINFAVPKYHLHTPHQHIPFQFSLHKLETPTSESIHTEYVHTSTSDPIPSILSHLENNLTGQGSILVWNKHFELSRNRYMAEVNPESAGFLYQLNNRIVDLMEVFSQGLWVDYRFGGSSSIKNILPILIPTLSYKDLGINHGGNALVSWYQLIYTDLPTQQQQQLISDLQQYCKLDTLAMVEVYRKIINTLNDTKTKF